MLSPTVTSCPLSAAGDSADGIERVLFTFYYHDLDTSITYKLSDLLIPYSRYAKSKQVCWLVMRQSQ